MSLIQNNKEDENMTIFEIVMYGLALLGTGFILWMSIRTTIRYLKGKGILKTWKMNLKIWEKKE